MTRVRVEPRLCNQGRHKNDTLALLATLPNIYHGVEAQPHEKLKTKFKRVAWHWRGSTAVQCLVYLNE